MEDSLSISSFLDYLPSDWTEMNKCPHLKMELDLAPETSWPYFLKYHMVNRVRELVVLISKLHTL
jgi:hypothetical protein